MTINTRKAQMSIRIPFYLKDAALRNWQSLPSSHVAEIRTVIGDLSRLAEASNFTIESLTNLGRSLVEVTNKAIELKFNHPYEVSDWVTLMVGFHVWVALYERLDIPVVDVSTAHFLHLVFYPTLETLLHVEVPNYKQC